MSFECLGLAVLCQLKKTKTECISSKGHVLTKFILCFQFLQLISVYYFVKCGGKQHQHQLNDVAYVVDML